MAAKLRSGNWHYGSSNAARRPISIRRVRVPSLILSRDILLQENPGALGRLLVGLLEAGSELKYQGLSQAPSTIERLRSEFERSGSALRQSQKFRSNLDRVAAGIRDANVLKAAEAFSGISDVLEDDHPKQHAALAFGEIALSLHPDSAVYSWKMGRLKRIRADLEAPSWYNRAIELGSQQNTWEPVARSWLGLSGIVLERKNYRSVARFALSALQIARLQSVSGVEPEALHNLAIAYFGLHRPREAINYAKLAFEEYGRRFADIAVLANDVATYMYLETGQFDRALPLFRTAYHAVKGDYNKLCVVGNLARAAGGARNGVEFRWAAQQVYRLAERVPEKQGAVDALTDVARGALSSGLLEEAADALEMAREAARSRKTSNPRELKPVADNLEALQRAEALLQERRGSSRSGLVDGDISTTMITTLKSTKMNAPLKRLLETETSPDHKTSVSIDCDPNDADLVEKLVVSVDGTLEGTIPTLRGVSVFASLPRSGLSKIIDSPVVIFVSLPLQYSVD